MTQMQVTMPDLHPSQRAVRQHPARFKVLACGRRWGKSRLGAVLCLATALQRGRAWWVAPSYKMARVGWRGLAQLARQIPGAQLGKAEQTMTLPTGGSVQVRSADDPQSLRGDGLDFVVLDECAYMHEAAWTEALRPALADRKGGALFISTPRGLNWFRALWLRGQAGLPDWQSWQFHSADNPYLDPAEIAAARETLLSRIFRQEFEADFLADAPGALWQRAWLDGGRVLIAPELRRIVVAIDPSATATGDEAGIVGAGVAGDGALYVLADASRQGTPEQWARAALTLYHHLRADALVAEANQGGEMIRSVLQAVDASVPVRLVHASRGKQTRAEPISAVYEQGRAHHVGEFPALEDELCQWEPGGASPNRLDALVWAATELLTGKRTTRMAVV